MALRARGGDPHRRAVRKQYDRHSMRLLPFHRVTLRTASPPEVWRPEGPQSPSLSADAISSHVEYRSLARLARARRQTRPRASGTEASVSHGDRTSALMI